MMDYRNRCHFCCDLPPGGAFDAETLGTLSEMLSAYHVKNLAGARKNVPADIDNAEELAKYRAQSQAQKGKSKAKAKGAPGKNVPADSDNAEELAKYHAQSQGEQGKGTGKGKGYTPNAKEKGPSDDGNATSHHQDAQVQDVAPAMPTPSLKPAAEEAQAQDGELPASFCAWLREALPQEVSEDDQQSILDC